MYASSEHASRDKATVCFTRSTLFTSVVEGSTWRSYLDVFAQASARINRETEKRNGQDFHPIVTGNSIDETGRKRYCDTE